MILKLWEKGLGIKLCVKSLVTNTDFKMATKKPSRKKTDEKFNFLSPKFDPLKALYSNDLQPPVPNIHIFNNLGEYANAIKEGKMKSSEYVKPTKAQASSRQSASRTRNLKPEYQPAEGNNLKERLKIISESEVSRIEKRKSDKKIEGRMDDAKLQEFMLAEEAFKAEQTKKKRMNVIQRMEGNV